MKCFFPLLLSCFFCVSINAQSNAPIDVPDAFENISETPVTYYFKSNKVKPPAGGHLQGIQAYSKNSQSYFVITGSSATYAYYVVAPLKGEATLHKISDEPFRHAGGCQVAGARFFTGVEDNETKDKANIVSIIPGDSAIQTIIKRNGIFERSTAGAVGAVKLKDNYLIAVADWDSRNIDFYRSGINGFDSVATFTAPVTGKWGSYQSINLLTDTAGTIYMIGFCRDGKFNRADLFTVVDYQLTPISSRYFECKNGCSFRYGAGIGITAKNELVIMACARKLKKRNSVNLFGFINSSD